MKSKTLKLLFFGTCVFYTLAALVFNGALGPPPNHGGIMMEHPPPIELHTPLDAQATPAWIACLVLFAIVLVLGSTLAWLAWSNRHALLRGNRIAFATMLLITPVMLKLAATKTNSTMSGATQGSQLNKQGTQGQNMGSTPTASSTLSTSSTPAIVATQPAYSLEAAAGATFTTNFFAGRLYPDPHTVVSRDGRHKSLSFAPIKEGGFSYPPNENNDLHDPDTPLGTLLAVYNLPPDIQAVVALVNLDGARSPSRATLLRAPNVALQQAATHWDDPRATGRMLRFQPLGEGRRMYVNNTETRLVPREGWCVVTLEADATHPMDLTLGTLGNDGSHSMGGAYWPGRVAEIVFIPREWQPDGSPLQPVAWDATLRNALESYLLHKHRMVQPRYTNLPPEYTITHGKVNLVETVLNLPKIKISGTLLLVR